MNRSDLAYGMAIQAFITGIPLSVQPEMVSVVQQFMVCGAMAAISFVLQALKSKASE